jgi:hypothetical protein
VYATLLPPGVHRTSLATLPMLSAGAEGPSRTEHTQKLHVVCVGGHPDDPESGCGGTLARYAALGHRVTIVYLTRGERGIPGKSLAEAAAIRTAEAERACEILGALPVFAGQTDGATEVNGDQTRRFTELLASGASRRRLHALADRHASGSPGDEPLDVPGGARAAARVSGVLLRGERGRSDARLRPHHVR